MQCEKCGSKLPRFWRVDSLIKDDEGELKLADFTGRNGRVVPLILRARFFDQHGAPVLIVASVDMEHLPRLAIDRLRDVLQAQQETPVLILPEKGVKLLKLEPISEIEARRLADEERRRAQEQPTEPSKIIL